MTTTDTSERRQPIVESILNVQVVNAIVLAVSFWLLRKWLLSKKRSLSGKQDAKRKTPPMSSASVLEVVTALSGTESPWLCLREYNAMDSKVFRFWVPGIGTMWVVGDYKLTRRILTHPAAEKALAFYQTMEGMVNCSTIFTRATHDVKWRNARKTTAHAFSSSQVKRMNTICRQHADQWIANAIEGPLSREGQESVSIDPSIEMARIVFGSLVEAAFEYNVTDEEFQRIHVALERAMTEYTARRIANPVRKFVAPFLTDAIAAETAKHETIAFGQKLLHAYRNNPQKSTNKTLIQQINNLELSTEQEKIGDLITFLVAGHDTTSYTIATVLCLLAQHPAEQAKVHASLNAAHPVMTTVLQNALTESRRLQPVTPMGSLRTMKQDVPDEDWGIIPAGVTLLCPQILINRDPDVFTDPDLFQPDRWNTPTNAMQDSLLSFSLGKRNCPGQSLAMAELTSILPRLLAAYSFHMEKKGTLEFFLTLKYTGSRLCVTKRK